MKEYIVHAPDDYKIAVEEYSSFYGEPITELIRCKDCIYWKEYCRIVDGVASDHVCSRKREIDGTMHRAKADDYCSWAKRKGGNYETNR